MKSEIRPGGVRSLLASGPGPQGVGIAWLGQAGFLICGGGRRIVIDPYLSDSLAEKYKGTEFPHVRLMPPPIEPAELHALDAVLCSHRHTDHMDVGTLSTLARVNPQCQFVVPAAEQNVATRAGVPPDRMLATDAGQALDVAPGVHVRVIPSAHEQLKTNERGEHHFLGFVTRISGCTLYHSGDCVPYDGLGAWLAGGSIDVAMLPVNGRDELRRRRGVPGNMTFDEAVEVCVAQRIGLLVPHHFGMFDFNSVPVEELKKRAAGLAGRVRCVVPDVNTWLELNAS